MCFSGKSSDNARKIINRTLFIWINWIWVKFYRFKRQPKTNIWPQDWQAWIWETWDIFGHGQSNTPKRGLFTPPLWPPRQENKGHPGNYRDSKRVQGFICSNRSKKLHPSRSCCQLPKIGHRPTSKCGRPLPPPESDWTIWGSKQVDIKIEYGYVKSREKNCETIAGNANNLLYKYVNKIQQDNQL